MYLRPSLTFLVLIAFLAQGCAPALAAVTAPPPQVTPTASPAAGSTRLRDQDAMTMVYVPQGAFQMGSDYLAARSARTLCAAYVARDAIASCNSSNYRDESPAHTVSLRGFWIDRTEVSNAQYEQCERAGACEPPIERGSHYRSSYYGALEFANYPVIFVRRDQAVAYCGWVGGRLPTEAEWEYAARGPHSLIFPWGDDFDGTRLNYCDLNCDAGPNDPTLDDGYADTAPVGSYPTGASWVGALDLAGNVREWVADWYGSYPAEAQTDPTGPATGELIVPHGGSWIDNPSIIRSANRGGNTTDYYRDYYGFRCAGD